MSSGVIEAKFDNHRASDEVRAAMLFRCEAEGHYWEGACTIWLHVYQICRWCGEEKH